MFNQIKVYLKNFDWILFSAVILLSALGLAEIYSIALGQESLDLLNFQKQIGFISLGVILLFLFAFLDYHFLKNSSYYIYIAGIIILVAVLIFGQAIRGTKGWFYFFGLGIQPVEFIKIILLIFLARFFSSVSMRSRPIKQLLLSGFYSSIFVALVLMQPDFGSALLISVIWFIYILLVGFDKKYFIAIGLTFVLAAALVWSFALKPYQKQRIITFINPSIDSLDQGYNANQAMIAVGSGGLIGRGLGFGSQSQLKFLPEAQNDFIFAVISEELGFVGSGLTLFLFCVIFYRCILSIKKTKNDFGVFFILTAMGLIFVEMFINIGMNTGIMPIVGISLPFVSYGGSAMLSSYIIIGIIESIIIRSKINY